MRIVFEEDPDLLRRMERRYERREEWARRNTGIIRRNIPPQLKLAAVSEHMAEIGAIGGRARSRGVAAGMRPKRGTFSPGEGAKRKRQNPRYR